MTKLPLALCLVALAGCNKKEDKPAATATASETKPIEAVPAKAAYSPDAAKQQLAALASCSSQYNCAAFDTLAGFGAAAGPDLLAFVSDASKPIAQRRLVALAIGKAKLADAGP